MKKDFTAENEQHLLDIVKSVEPDGFWETVGDWFGDIGLRITGQGLNLSDYLGNVDEYHRAAFDRNNTTASTIRRIFGNVRNDDAAYGEKVKLIHDQAGQSTVSFMRGLANIMRANPEQVSVGVMRTYLGALYRGMIADLRELPNPVYDNEEYRTYGGNQGSAIRRWNAGDTRDLAAVVRRHHPNYSDVQIGDFLSNMNNVGCEYTALSNTIFRRFVGREAEFERIFGFPMYDEAGNLNTDLLLVDFYCTVNGQNVGGLTDSRAERLWESYMRQRGIPSDVIRNINCTTDNFEELSQRGEIIVAISPLRLRDASGRLVDTRNGGHAMTITGVVSIAGREMYKVSSWGDIYYIDPNDLKGWNKRISYIMVTYDE